MVVSQIAAVDLEMAAASTRRVSLFMLDEERFRASEKPVHMDPALWGELPLALVELVVAKLPARTQAGCRTLSRSWATLPPVPSLQMAPLAPAVCAFQQQSFEYQNQRIGLTKQAPGLAGFRGLFHDLDLAFLPPRFLNWQDGVTRVFSQSGLMCIAYRDWDLNELCICLVNPHNRTWRELPRLDWRRWSSYRYSSECEIKVVAAPGALGAFKVLVLTEILFSLTTLSVFSSAENAWTTTPHNFGLGVSLRARRENRHVVCNNQLYGLVGVDNRWEEVVVLDADTGQELRRLPHLPHTGLTDVHLAEYRGKVVWVEKDDLPRIWMLGENHKVEEWELIASMPQELQLRMKASLAAVNELTCPFQYHLKDAQLAGDMVFLNLASSGQTYLVAYHLNHRSWQFILRDASHNCDFHFLEAKVDLRL